LEWGELALSLQRQGVSIELIALPLFRLSGHRDHVIEGLFGIGSGFLRVATQRVDARAQRDEKSGFTYTFTRMLVLQSTPLHL
jgi:hypothetical protein